MHPSIRRYTLEQTLWDKVCGMARDIDEFRALRAIGAALGPMGLYVDIPEVGEAYLINWSEPDYRSRITTRSSDYQQIERPFFLRCYILKRVYSFLETYFLAKTDPSQLLGIQPSTSYQC